MGYQKLDKALKDIDDFKYQGATAVARAVLDAYDDFGKHLGIKQPKNWLREMKAAATYLIKNNRPTEPLARNGLFFVWERIKKQPDKFVLHKSVLEFNKIIDDTVEDISKLGRLIIKKGDNVYTHCHSTTVENLLVKTYSQKKFKVYNSETRPLYQGRITAKRLRSKKIPVTLVVDSAAPFLISTASGRDLMMDQVLIGADVIEPDGSVINKIGSYGIALAAEVNKVPVYIVSSLLKYARNQRIKLEHRPAKEIWSGAPAGLNILNLAFDRVPAANITGIVCEFGVLNPSEVKRYIKKYYPWLKR